MQGGRREIHTVAGWAAGATYGCRVGAGRYIRLQGGRREYIRLQGGRREIHAVAGWAAGDTYGCRVSGFGLQAGVVREIW